MPMTFCAGEDDITAAQPCVGGEFFRFLIIFCHAEIERSSDTATFQHPLGSHCPGQADAFPGGIVCGGTDCLTDEAGLFKIGGY